MMIKYSNFHGDSGVTAYEIGNDRIIIEFTHDKVYLYTYKSAGRKNIEMMKKLAQQGKGLSTYIATHVSKLYEQRLK